MIDTQISMLRTLKTAMQHHGEWLRSIHLKLLCPAAQQTPVHDSERASRALADCLDTLGNTPQLRDQRLIQQLGKSHRALHRAVNRMLAGRSAQGSLCSEAYALFTRHAERMNRLLCELQLCIVQQAGKHDPLTAVLNRRDMFPMLEQQRNMLLSQGQPGSVCMLDLDYFKQLNDTHGHQAGDTILREVAACITHQLRQHDKLFRYGGEEFLICLPNINSAQAASVIERIRQAVNLLSFDFGAHTGIRITASWGVASLHTDSSLEQTIDLADAALYAAKRAGRDRLIIADSSSPATTLQLRAWPHHHAPEFDA